MVFVALQVLTVGDRKGDRKVGQPVPEAAGWNPQIVRNLVKQGKIRDMTPEEAEAAVKAAEADDRVGQIKAAQKSLRKAMVALQNAEPELKAAEGRVADVMARVEKVSKAADEAKATLRRLGATDAPDMSNRTARAAMRAALVAKDAEIHAPPPEPEPETLDEEGPPEATPILDPEDPEAGFKLRVRLGGLTKTRLMEDYAEPMGLEVSAWASKATVVEAIAEAVEGGADLPAPEQDTADED